MRVFRNNIKMKIAILFIVVLFSLMNCSPYLKYYDYESDDEQLGQIKTVMITPLDLIQIRPKGTTAAQMIIIEEKIYDHLKQRGIEILPNETLVKSWQKETENTNGFFDPMSGKIDEVKVKTCLLKSLDRTREAQKCDAIILIKLVLRPARLAGDRIYWDGCAKKIFEMNGDVAIDRYFTGEMPAISLLVQVFDSTNQVIFKNIGGVTFPYRLSNSYSQSQFLWEDSVKFEESELKEGIGIAFHPFVPFSEYPDSPSYYDKKKE